MSLRMVSETDTSDLHICVTLGCIPSIFQGKKMELQLLQLVNKLRGVNYLVYLLLPKEQLIVLPQIDQTFLESSPKFLEDFFPHYALYFFQLPETDLKKNPTTQQPQQTNKKTHKRIIKLNCNSKLFTVATQLFGLSIVSFRNATEIYLCDLCLMLW